jgi:hypothetical protein
MMESELLQSSVNPVDDGRPHQATEEEPANGPGVRSGMSGDEENLLHLVHLDAVLRRDE